MLIKKKNISLCQELEPSLTVLFVLFCWVGNSLQARVGGGVNFCNNVIKYYFNI